MHTGRRAIEVDQALGCVSGVRTGVSILLRMLRDAFSSTNQFSISAA
jgi:hypothetical protein